MAELEAVGDLADSGMSSSLETIEGLVEAARRLIELHPGLIRLRVAHGDCMIEMDCSPRTAARADRPEDQQRAVSQAPPPGRHRRAPDADS